MNRIKLVVLLFAISNLFSSTDDDYEIISVVSKILKNKRAPQTLTASLLNISLISA